MLPEDGSKKHVHFWITIIIAAYVMSKTLWLWRANFKIIPVDIYFQSEFWLILRGSFISYKTNDWMYKLLFHSFLKLACD